MKIEKILEKLRKLYRHGYEIETPFRLLITTILSQRTKDETTEGAAKRLFEVVKTPKDILRLSTIEIAKLIYPVGFYKRKSETIKKLCEILVKEYSGEVPGNKEDLLKLPGVGQKTASIVLSYGFGVPTVAVDTHVNRISQRLGLVPIGSKPEETQKILEKLIPKKLQIEVNNLFVNFGKNICKPRNPLCASCPIKIFCKFYRQKNTTQ